MRRIERTTVFRRDFKRIKARHTVPDLDEILVSIVSELANDEVLDKRRQDHALVGNWRDHRECHLRPDLLLIYRKPDERTLQLMRLGSHSDLFR